jgi:hypothetical protein
MLEKLKILYWKFVLWHSNKEIKTYKKLLEQCLKLREKAYKRIEELCI